MDKRIRILPSGPYEVFGGIPLREEAISTDSDGTSLAWAEGKQYPESTSSYCLCRCGHSSEKPYCDGTHEAVGFTGEETAGHEPFSDNVTLYEGETLDLLDNEALCASLRFCERGLGVWDAVLQSGSEENRRTAIEEACNCAAGRLVVVEKDGTPLEMELQQEICPIEDTAAGWLGPLWVKGGVPLVGADGEPYEVRNRVTLCRCGESENLPFCDTSHLRCPHMKGPG